jgi:hypothetical protein
MGFVLRPFERDEECKRNLHEVSNDNGPKSIEFATSKNMVISSTCFSYKEIRKRTWASPAGIVFHIDLTLVDRRFASNFFDVRPYRGAICDSDRYLAKFRFRFRINVSRPVNGGYNTRLT